MSDTIREYRGDSKDDALPIREYQTDEPSNVMLNDNQVEALISAIESSPLHTNGKSSELAIQAALYLTGDEPEKREQDFVDQLVLVTDENVLQKELMAFNAMYRDFSTSTSGEEDVPQVLQTKKRLKRIVSLLAEAIQYSQQLNNEPMPRPKRESDVQTDSDQLTAISPASTSKPSIFESNWFKFAAFSILAIVILLAIVFLVQWFRVKHEESAQDVKIDRSAKSSETLI